MYQTIRYEKNGNIGIATINRPEALNALNSTVISELEQLISEVEKDAELGAFIITGEGRSFVAAPTSASRAPWTWPPPQVGPAGQRPVPPDREAGDPHHRRSERLRSGRRL